MLTSLIIKKHRSEFYLLLDSIKGAIEPKTLDRKVLFNLKIGNYIRSDYKDLMKQDSVYLHCLIVIDLIDFAPPIISNIT